jgi:Tol biopolymer transport system component
MTLPPGARLGPFDVVGLLGAGGMGAVYRAHDPRLKRDVAIKVLPPEFARDPDRLRRFEQEALAVARLAHPNILAVHDIGSHDGSPFIVTELLEGSTLRNRMADRPLPGRKAVEYATAVAQGLAAAHEQGVVHRDIKPENLFVTRDDRIKILDFGVAKLTDLDAAEGTGATLTAHELIGTAAYMSPEQARGARVDQRSDLFSLGVVLYEMLSGVSPFRRDTAPETMTAILRDEPPDLPAASQCPPALERIVRHCLEKNPSGRFQTARDLIFALESLTALVTAAVVPSPARPSRRFLVPALSLIAIALVGWAAFAVGRRTASTINTTLDVGAVHRVTDLRGLEEFPAIAPDLKSIAFTAWVDGVRQIFVRLVAGGTPLQITQDDRDHQLPRWSADASSIIYFSPAVPGANQGTIWEIPALGGQPRRVMDSVGGGDIDREGRIAAFRLGQDRVELVSTDPETANAKVLARLEEPVYYRYPRWSPDAKWIAYQRGDGFRWDIFVVAASGGTPRQLTSDKDQIHGLAWLPDSSGLIYSSGRSTTMPYLPTLGLWEIALAGGEPRRIAVADQSYLQPDLQRSGTMVASRLQLQFDVWTYPVDGAPEDNVRRAVRLTRQTGQVQTPTASADHREVAFLSDSGGHSNLWVTNIATGALRQITHERDHLVSLGVPIWSPDGKWIAFVSSRGNVGLDFGVWVVGADGGNLRNAAARGLGVAWSHDAKWLYYIEGGNIYKVAAQGGTPVQVRSGPARNVVGSDGTTLYFMVDRTLADGTAGFEVHAAAPEAGPSRVVAQIPAGRVPQWQIINPSLSPDGEWLAMPLTDGVTTNIWMLSTRTLEWRKITDFGDRPTFIARRVSWSADGKSIVAAVGEGDADIILFEPRRAQ